MRRQRIAADKAIANILSFVYKDEESDEHQDDLHDVNGDEEPGIYIHNLLFHIQTYNILYSKAAVHF